MLRTLEIPGWHPTLLNKLYDGHWAARARLKAADAQTLAAAVLVYAVPPATGKRRVRLHVVLAPRQRAGDPDAYAKSLLDGLVLAGALKDDNRQWCEWERPTFSRGEHAVSYVTLEDVQ